jgi:hypothetical protein
MEKALITEEDLTKALPLTPRKLRRLRLQARIPYIKVDRYTRLYCLEQVLAALQKAK